MNKILIACASSLLFMASAASAIDFSAQAGRHYTNLGVGFGTQSGGLAISGNWARSDHNGEMGGLGLGFNFPVGPSTLTVGGKAIYMNPAEGKKGTAAAIGGGLRFPLNKSISLYGEGYYAPEALTSGMKAYTEASGGVRWNVVRPLNLDVGYRYIDMAGKDGRRNNRLAEGIYIGAGLTF